MTAVTEARDAYLAARKQVTETRLALGRAIAEARQQNIAQLDIARKLGLTREQVRRYQAEYEMSLPGRQTQVNRVLEAAGLTEKRAKPES